MADAHSIGMFWVTITTDKHGLRQVTNIRLEYRFKNTLAVPDVMTTERGVQHSVCAKD